MFCKVLAVSAVWLFYVVIKTVPRLQGRVGQTLRQAAFCLFCPLATIFGQSMVCHRCQVRILCTLGDWPQVTQKLGIFATFLFLKFLLQTFHDEIFRCTVRFEEFYREPRNYALSHRPISYTQRRALAFEKQIYKTPEFFSLNSFLGEGLLRECREPDAWIPWSLEEEGHSNSPKGIQITSFLLVWLFGWLFVWGHTLQCSRLTLISALMEHSLEGWKNDVKDLTLNRAFKVSTKTLYYFLYPLSIPSCFFFFF